MDNQKIEVLLAKGLGLELHLCNNIFKLRKELVQALHIEEPHQNYFPIWDNDSRSICPFEILIIKENSLFFVF